MRPLTFAHLQVIFRGLVRSLPLLGISAHYAHAFLIVLPVALLAVPSTAQAAATCTAQADPVVIIYQSGAAALNKVIGGDGNLSCNGLTAGTYYMPCFGSGAESVPGTGGTTVSPFRKARSATGATINYQIYYGVYANIYAIQNNAVYAPDFPAASSYGTSDLRTSYYYISVPSQAVAAGDYTTTLNFPAYIASNCGGTPVASFNVSVTVTIRVGGTCLISDATQGGNFGTLVGDGSGNIAQTSAWMILRGGCSVGTSYNLTISDGLNASGTGLDRRRLRNGSSYIRYELKWADSTNIYNTFPAGGLNFTGDGGINTLFGTMHYQLMAQIAAGQPTSGLVAGTYSDTLIGTITW